MATSSLVSFGADSLVTTVTVPIVDDSVGEHEEVFYGNLTAVGNFIVQIPQDRADIHINDDDGEKNVHHTLIVIIKHTLFSAQSGYGLSPHHIRWMRVLEQSLSL